MGLPEGVKGAAVIRVMPDSPADEAGLEVEDIIVRVDGNATENVNELRNVIASIAPGEEVDVVLYRGGQKRTVEVKIEVQPKELAMGRMPGGGGTESAALGLRLADLTPKTAEQYGYDEDTEGVVISEVEDGSDAAEEGLRPGMVITMVQGDPVETVTEFIETLEAVDRGELVRLRVRDAEGNARLVFLKMD
jgi:serine protease Do